MLSNYDKDIGIHYGAISQNSLCIEAMENWYDHDALYDELLIEVTQIIQRLSEIADISEEMKEDILMSFNDNYQNDEPQFYYEDLEYKTEYSHSLNCWIILKSPFYTYCKPCSPCVPNAGDLDNPVRLSDKEREDNIKGYGKTYCLPLEFFDEYRKIPYWYYRVLDNTEVIEPIIEVD